MTTDIRLQLSFRHHPKMKKLKFMLGNDAVVSFIWLLMFVAESKPDGLLDGMDEIDVAIASDWDGDAEEYVEALVATRFLDRVDKGYEIHDWAENNPWAAGATERSERARNAANMRHHGTKKQQVKTIDDTLGIDEPCSEHDSPMPDARNSNAPSPSPSPSPSPTPNPIHLSKPQVSPCPHEEIIAAYHKELPELQRVLVARWPGSAGEKNLRTRWRENAEHQSVDWWCRFFSAVRTNPHWLGQNDRGWRADLRWLIERRNFDKVLERWANAA